MADKPKKKFKDTGVGKFLLEKIPNAVGVLGDVLPDKGVLGIVKNIISQSTELSEADREMAYKLLEQDNLEMEEVTKRWQSDMSSDSWLSKNIRPLALAFLTLTLFIYIILDSSIKGFEVDEAWIGLLSSLLLVVYSGYFGARTVEKVAQQWGKKNKNKDE